MTLLGQVHPIGFVQLGPDQVIQIANLLVFSDQGGCDEASVSKGRRPLGHLSPTGQAQLGVRFHSADALPELVGRGNVHLVQEQKAPFPGPQKVHKLFRVMRTDSRIGDHAVRRDDDPSSTLFGTGELSTDSEQSARPTASSGSTLTKSCS